jgi:2-keto-3-deoxy-L-rhamnonate aldolase RhmA
LTFEDSQVGIATHLKTQDACCAVIAMIEDASAIDEIVQVEGLDALFIGRAHLAVTMAT